VAVTATELEYGGDEDLAVAGVRHDSVEANAWLDDVLNRFGEPWRARDDSDGRHGTCGQSIKVVLRDLGAAA